MLRPERMSKVSVTGEKSVMSQVIEASYDLNLIHLSDYDGDWDGFDNGSPFEDADEASEALITIRSLQSMLGVPEDHDAGNHTVSRAAIDETLEDVRQAVNAVDDRRAELRDELHAVEDRIDALEPFVDLGIDLDLLSGYDAVDVAVGDGDADDVERAVADAPGIRAHQVFGGGRTVAVFAYPSDDAEDPLDDALVGVEFASLEVPDADGSPESVRADLEREREALESELDTVENRIADLRHEHADFLLAAEETLAIEVDKAEAPLQFATTDRAFVAEGWLPTDEYARFASALRDAVGERVDVDEIERAAYTPSHGHSREVVAETGGDAAAADGGYEIDEDESPPVVQDNPDGLRPFELLVETIGKPLYFEVDPTVVLFLTFPLFFGFMIGDIGYGVLYAGLGYWLYTGFDSDALKSLGGIAMWAGLFTAVFGVLYGEVFGTHFVATYLWEGVFHMGGAPLHKGLHSADFAELWLTMSVIVGLVHLAVGYVFGFVNDLTAHGLEDAVYEDGSWIVLLIGVWAWIFSTQAAGSKPAFMVGPESVFNGHPVPLGFTGLPPVTVLELGGFGVSLWLLVIVVGLAMAYVGEGGIALLESLTNGLVNVVSYTRLAAVLIAKAGMAFVVNLLVFGAYEEHTDHGTVVHFAYDGHIPEHATALFGGLVHAGLAGVVGGLLVLIAGHLVVLGLGVTSAGLQAVRLEYVEFFGKFYEGGGENYQPFGYRRTYTTED